MQEERKKLLTRSIGPVLLGALQRKGMQMQMTYSEAVTYLATLGVPTLYRHQCIKHLRGRLYPDDLEAMADWCLDSISEGVE